MNNFFEKNKKKLFFIFIIFIILLFLFILFFVKNKKDVDNFSSIKINKTILQIELAQSPREYYLGLSHRESLKNISGMLFLFPNKKIRAFVMRDMLMSIDIIFIDNDAIVNVYKEVPFDLKLQKVLYQSSSPVDKVLELEAGLFDYYNFKIGDKIEILKK